MAPKKPHTGTPTFGYGDTATPGVNNIYPMTGGNSLPAMSVWLFLVTNPQFLDQLSGVQNVAPSDTMPTAVAISKATNLNVKTVNSILDSYRKPPISGEEAQRLKTSFRDVSNAFQAYSSGSGYNGGFCPPPNGTAIIALTTNGAAVDPSAV